MGIKMKKAIALIPTRLESKRLPGKALLEVDGLPIVVHTAKRSQLAKNISETFVCTDSEEIIQVCNSFDIQTIKTEKSFNNGTERIASISERFGDSLIVDVQGDEPLIKPDFIDMIVESHLKSDFDPEIMISTIDVPYNSGDTIVKVISSTSKRVMMLSRANIPYRYKSEVSVISKHCSVISFTQEALTKFSKLPQSFLESIEDVELLRAIENDMRVYSCPMDGNSFSIDVNDDYLKAKVAMQSDPTRKLY